MIREVRPQVIVTYDTDGFYPHPDHVQAQAVTWRAYQMACDPVLTKFYAVTMPRSVLAEAITGTPWSGGQKNHPPAASLRAGPPDDQVTTEIDAAAYLDAKLAALKAHATSYGGRAVLHASRHDGNPALGTEYYALRAGPGASERTSGGQCREDDLFSPEGLRFMY